MRRFVDPYGMLTTRLWRSLWLVLAVWAVVTVVCELYLANTTSLLPFDLALMAGVFTGIAASRVGIREVRDAPINPDPLLHQPQRQIRFPKWVRWLGFTVLAVFIALSFASAPPMRAIGLFAFTTVIPLQAIDRSRMWSAALAARVMKEFSEMRATDPDFLLRTSSLGQR